MTKVAFFGFGWLRPGVALWALVAVVLLALGLWAASRRARALESLVAARQLKRFAPGWSVNRARARFFLAALAVMFLALASAGPVRGFTLREVKRRGLDIVVCLDTSRSMLVRDLRPDRITRARREVRGLLERLRGDRMALIAFAGDAREVAPLTHDRLALASLLESMTPAENEKGGTDLGAALERALAMFDGRTGAHECILMLTDGEDLEGHGLEVARKAAERGVKVFVAGMGTEAGGKIPIERPGGGEAFLRDSKNQEVVSSMGGRGLDELATSTGGAYLSADSSAAPLEELYEKRVARMEARELQGGQEFVPHDRYQWFLGLGAACMLLAAGIGERRSRSRQRNLAKQARNSGHALGAAQRPKPAWARAIAPLFLFSSHQTPPVVAPDAATLPAPSAPAVAPAPAVVPYEHSVAQGLRELRAMLDANALDEAKALGERLVAMANLSENARGEIEYHRGVLLERRSELAASSAAFARSGGLCAPGPLRLDAWYNSGTAILEGSEPLFLSIPEVRKSRNLPPLEPAAVAPAPNGEKPKEPKEPKENEDLDHAMAAYQAARQGLVHRLRAEARDVDTRANLELIQRRLREIEKIRKQREEAKKEQQKEPDPDKQDKKDPKDSKDKPEDKDKPQDKDKKPEQDPDKDESKEKKPEEKENPEQKKPEDEQKQEGDKGKPPPPKQQKPGEERALSKEEVSRLMDQLANIEQEAKQLQARIRARRRAPVEKDW